MGRFTKLTKEGKILGREEILSKLNIKNYNNELENIIEKKAFSEDTKNLLLSMFYKIENGYNDYKKIKGMQKTKKEELEEVLNTINSDCEKIELIKPRIGENTNLGDKKAIVITEEKKVIAYPNEKAIYYGICLLKEPKYSAETEIDIIDKSINTMMNIGAYLNEAEVIRDFDGWTWNIEKNDIDNYLYNLIYQNMLLLLGEKKLNKWRNNKNYFKTIKEKLEEKTYNKICKIALTEYLRENTDEEENVKKILNSLNEELSTMINKREYLENIAKAKRKNEEEIRKIDTLISNLKELKDEFARENSKREEDKKIFSLSDFVEIKQNERQILIDEIKNYSRNMRPNFFVEKKDKIKKKIEILEDSIDKDTEFKTMIDIQKEVLKDFLNKITKIETKKEIYDMIYKLRYYKELFINDEQKIKDIKELKTQIRNAEKAILTVACNFKILNILSNSVEENYTIMQEIFNTSIIDLEDIVLEFKEEENNIILNIYEDEILSKTIKYKNFKELNQKFGKKIKLFI